MMDQQQMLGVLLHMNEQQSENTEKLLAQLELHVAALEAATKSANDAAPAIGKAAGEAAGAAVRIALANGPETALRAFTTSSRPFFERLKTMTDAADTAGGNLATAGAWVGWKLSAICAGVVAVAGMLGYAGVWWERRQVEALQEEKAALQVDVGQLRTQVADLEKRGGRVKFSACGARLCIEAASNQGTGQVPWVGPYANTTTGQQFVIPKGY